MRRSSGTPEAHAVGGPPAEAAALEAAYRTALARYLDEPRESERMRAYALGRQAVAAGLGLIEFASIHARAADDALPQDARQAAATDFLIEALSTFDMAQSGYREASAQAAEEHAIAVALQKSLLPAGLPPVDGAEIAVRYVPAASALEVGGDWYDVVPLPGCRVALVVGDVMGHGLRSAAVMGQIRLGIRAHLIEGVPLGEVLSRVDTVLRHVGESRTATAVIVLVDLAERTATYVRAGHPPPALVTPGGDVELLSGGHGRLLGLDGDLCIAASGPVALDPGTRLVLYTDGLLTRYERAGENPDPALRSALRTPVARPDDLLDVLMDTMLDGPPHDDVCLVGVRLT